jgi:hypothetical protein
VTVARRHEFTLDDATLSGGASIVAAGSGLPRRITPRVDYSTVVLGLSPTGYWRLDENSATHVDLSGNGNNLIDNGSGAYSRQQAGHRRGGDTGLAETFNPNAFAYTAAAGTPAMLDFYVGTGFTIAWWMLPTLPVASVPSTGNRMQFQTRGTGGTLGGGTGYALRINGSDPTFYIYNSTLVQASTVRFSRIDSSSLGAIFCYPAWHHIAIVYTGGPTASASSWIFYLNGVAQNSTITSGANMTSGQLASAAPFNFGNMVAGAYPFLRFQDLAIWNNKALTADEVMSLYMAAPSPLTRARWTLAADAVNDRTLHGIELPGSLSRNLPTSTDQRHGVRCYYSLNGGTDRTEFDPGDGDLDLSVPAGTAVTLDADFMHHDIADLPWIGGPAGEGPVAVYEEPDPPAPPQYVATVRPQVGTVGILSAQYAAPGVVHPVPSPATRIIQGA